MKIIKKTTPYIAPLLSILIIFLFAYFKKCFANPFKGNPFVWIAILGFIVSLAVLIINNRIGKPINWEKTTFMLVLTFGIAFSFLNPVLDTPDEHAHFRRAEITADLIFFPSAANPGEYPSNIGTEELVDHIHQLYTEVKDIPQDSVFTNAENVMSQNTFIGYIPQAIGISIARLFHLPVVWHLYLGRIMNSLFAAILGFLTVRWAPRSKSLFFVLATLPMSVYLAASVSIDVLVNYGSLLLCSYYLRLYSSEKIEIKDISIFLISAFVLGMAKLTLGAWALLIFAFPKEKLSFHKIWLKLFSFLLCFSVLLIVWFAYTQTLVLPVSYIIRNETLNVNTAGQIRWILQNPLKFLQVLFTSMINIHIADFNVFGWLTYSSPILTIMTLMVILAQLFLDEECEDFSLGKRVLFIFIAFIIYSCTYLIMYLSWSPVGNPTVEGVQMRYFIPLIILIPWAFCRRKKIKFPELLNQISLSGAVICLNCVSILTLVQYYFG